jgi:pyruvate carboxylase
VSSGHGRWGEGDILVPDGPDNPAQFIRDLNRRFVVATTFLDRHGPLMHTRQRLGLATAAMSGNEHGASAVRQQASR